MPGGSTSSPKIKQDNNPWKQAVPYLLGTDDTGRIVTTPPAGMTGVFEAAYSDIMDRPQTFYPGQTYADTASQTEAGLSAMERAATGNPISSAAVGELGRTLGGEYLLEGNPYTSAMIERSIAPLRDEYTGVINPALDSQFAASGRYGSGALFNAKERAADQYARRVGDVATGINYANYGDERSRMFQGLGMAPTIAGMPASDAARLLAVGQAREELAQRPIDEAIARHEFAQNEPLNRINNAANIFYGGAGLGGSSSQSGGGPSLYQNILQGLGMGGQLGALGYLAASDRRLKTDITRIGELLPGVGWYHFRYRGDDAVHQGVMADEVMSVIPAAVHRDDDGYLLVDYGLISQAVARVHHV